MYNRRADARLPCGIFIDISQPILREFIMGNVVARLLVLSVILTAISLTGCGSRAGNAANKAKPIDEDRFFILLFPNQAELADRSGQTHTIDRAALGSVAGLDDDVFSLFIDGAEHDFPATAFTLQPKNGDVAKHVQRLNEELKKWGPPNTDWRDAQFVVEESKNTPPARATLRVKDHRGRTVTYVYEIQNSRKANPLSVKIDSGRSIR